MTVTEAAVGWREALSDVLAPAPVPEKRRTPEKDWHCGHCGQLRQARRVGLQTWLRCSSCETTTHHLAPAQWQEKSAKLSWLLGLYGQLGVKVIEVPRRELRGERDRFWDYGVVAESLEPLAFRVELREGQDIEYKVLTLRRALAQLTRHDLFTKPSRGWLFMLH